VHIPCRYESNTTWTRSNEHHMQMILRSIFFAKQAKFGWLFSPYNPYSVDVAYYYTGRTTVQWRGRYSVMLTGKMLLTGGWILVWHMAYFRWMVWFHMEPLHWLICLWQKLWTLWELKPWPLVWADVLWQGRATSPPTVCLKIYGVDVLFKITTMYIQVDLSPNPQRNFIRPNHVTFGARVGTWYSVHPQAYHMTIRYEPYL